MQSGLNTFCAALTAALTRWEISVAPTRLEQLRAHYEAVVEANRSMNLTRITEPVDAAVLHYADSLALLPWVEKRRLTIRTMLDVGTGAGFPAVPLAVMRPDWSVTAIDATGKKVDFLRRTTAAIGLTNLRCEHAHSEHWKPSASSGQPSAIRFQLVVFRALTTLAKALQQTAGFVVPGGWLAAYKTATMDQEEKDTAARLAPRLKLISHECHTYELELKGERLDRVLLIYRKSP